MLSTHFFNMKCIYTNIFAINFDQNHPNDESHIDMPKEVYYLMCCV